jgi:predicted nucleic acid-binding protein
VSPQHAQDAAELLGEPLRLTGLDAIVAARLFNLTERRRGSLPDCLIAATAVNAAAALATSDRDCLQPLVPLGLAIARG